MRCWRLLRRSHAQDRPQLCTTCAIVVIITKASHTNPTPPPRIRSSEHSLTLVSLKLAISDHITTLLHIPTPRLGLSFVCRNWKITLVETVSKRPRPRLVCYSAVDKVLIYALSPLPPSLFSFLLLFHTHHIHLPRRRLASVVHLYFFVSSLSYIHFLIYIPLLPVRNQSFHSNASRSGTFKSHTL